MILVTGGTGLVGSHLLLDLALKGERTRAIRRKSSSLQKVRNVFTYGRSKADAEKLFQRVEWAEADITDVPALIEAFKGISFVYHCAALVSFSPSEYRRLRKANIEGTANVVNLCIENRVKKLCFVSSIATFDLKLGQQQINEAAFWNKELDHSMYAISKYGAEVEVWRASQEGVPVVIVNPGVIIGPGSWDSGSGLLFSKIWKGLNYTFPKTTGFVGIRDVVNALQLLMNSPVENQQFILVSENLSFQRVMEMVAGSLEKPAPKTMVKPWMVFLAWFGELLLAPFGRKRQFTRDSSTRLFTHTFYDSSRFRESFNYEFEPMEKVVEATAKAYKFDCGLSDDHLP